MTDEPEDLRPWGYAPGGYMFTCVDCPPDLPFTERAMGDKRSRRCREHAISARDATAHPPQPDALAKGDVKITDWLKLAKLAGEHGIRYRTNRALEQFLTAIQSHTTPDTEADKGPSLPEAFPATISPGIVIDDIGGNCPVQSEGTIDGQPFYFRARGTAWALWIGEKEDWFTDKAWHYGESYHPESLYDAGWMDREEALTFILKGAAVYRQPRHFCAS